MMKGAHSTAETRVALRRKTSGVSEEALASNFLRYCKPILREFMLAITCELATWAMYVSVPHLNRSSEFSGPIKDVSAVPITGARRCLLELTDGWQAEGKGS